MKCNHSICVLSTIFFSLLLLRTLLCFRYDIIAHVMAKVCVCGNNVALTCGDTITAFYLRSDNVVRCQLPSISAVDVSQTSGEQIANDGNSGSYQILAAVFSPSGKLFAATNDHKQLTIWNVSEGWNLMNTRLVPHRATAIEFTQCENYLLVADKAGDVHQFAVDAVENVAGKLLMGHVSMLLDMKLCMSDKFLVTCDRDEKVRVTHFPNTYNIQSFCLGHSEYVSRLNYVEEDDLLLSGSSDGSIKLWRYVDGELLDSVDYRRLLNDETHDNTGSDEAADDGSATTTSATTDIRCLVSSGRSVAAAFDGHSAVLLFKIIHTNGTSTLKFCRRLPLSGVVWDLAFVNNHQLLALQCTENKLATAYTFADFETFSDLAELNDKDGRDPVGGLMEVIGKINADNDLFTAAKETSTFQVLKKAHIDNLSEYIEKKKRLLKEREAAKQTVDSRKKHKSDS